MAPTINPPIYDMESPPRAGRPVKYLVVHTAECAEFDGADDAISAYLARMSNSSIHCSIDNNSITPSVPEDRIAWAASNPNINNFALQAEWVGRADQGVAGWADQFSRDQMEVAAWLYARWATDHSIPVRHGSVDDLRMGVPGFYGHVDSTRAWNNPDGHYDPGPTFPWDRFLDRVRAYQGAPQPIIPTEEDMADQFQFPAKDGGYTYQLRAEPTSPTGYAWVNVSLAAIADAQSAGITSTNVRPLAQGADANDALFGRHPVLSGPHKRDTVS